MENTELILDYEQPIQSPEFYLASSGSRLANYILDRIGIYILIFMMSSAIEIGFYSSFIADILTALMVLMIPAYWILSEYFLGKTPAKFITKTKVVTRDGQRPSFLTIVGRTLCRLIPFEQFSFLGAKAVGWHDSISNTRVVIDEFPQL